MAIEDIEEHGSRALLLARKFKKDPSVLKQFLEGTDHDPAPSLSDWYENDLSEFFEFLIENDIVDFVEVPDDSFRRDDINHAPIIAQYLVSEDNEYGGGIDLVQVHRIKVAQVSLYPNHMLFVRRSDVDRFLRS